ncbi:hypothetical protein AB0G73_24295 [Streptomyces sp. NPDC020719]|uniref:hypothetical protein n=1 Tax=Streptomyces sp. NPDC020719 TaxID=3154896 RepID=UPI0033C2DBAE
MPSSPERARLVGTGEIGTEFGIDPDLVSKYYADRDTTGFPEVAGTQGRKRLWEHGAVADWFALVGTAEIAAEFGVSTETVTHWYKHRDATGFPESVGSRGRGKARLWEHDAVAAWYAGQDETRLQQAGRAAGGDPDELLNATQAAHLLGYKNANQITTYLRDRPGYFPDPDVTEELGTPERPWIRRQWRRSTITAWAADRPGSGRRRGSAPPAPALPEVSPEGDPDELLTVDQAAALLGFKSATSFSSSLSQGNLPLLKETDGILPGARGRARQAWSRHRILEQAAQRSGRGRRTSSPPR